MRSLEDGTASVRVSKLTSELSHPVSTYSSIRLQELGPRLTLELMKVERGLCEGEVLYHSYVTKTAEEVSSGSRRTTRSVLVCLNVLENREITGRFLGGLDLENTAGKCGSPTLCEQAFLSGNGHSIYGR